MTINLAPNYPNAYLYRSMSHKSVNNYRNALQDAINEALSPHPIDSIPL